MKKMTLTVWKIKKKRRTDGRQTPQNFTFRLLLGMKSKQKAKNTKTA